jgi:hypothetical protein
MSVSGWLHGAGEALWTVLSCWQADCVQNTLLPLLPAQPIVRPVCIDMSCRHRQLLQACFS